MDYFIWMLVCVGVYIAWTNADRANALKKDVEGLKREIEQLKLDFADLGGDVDAGAERLRQEIDRLKQALPADSR